MTKAKKEFEPTEVLTPPCRLAFPALFKPKPVMKGSTVEKYQATILIPPDVDLAPFFTAVKAACIAKWGKVPKLRADRNPIKDCGDKSDINGYEEGWHYINVKSQFAPSVVDQRAEPIMDQERIFPGCWCRFHVNAFAYEHQTGNGVSFGLNAVQLIKADDRLDGRRNAADIFDPVEMDDESESEMFDSESDAQELFG